MIIYKETKDEIITEIHSNMNELKNIKALYESKEQVLKEYLITIDKKMQDEKNEEKIKRFTQLQNSTKNVLSLLSNQMQEINKKILNLQNLETDIEKSEFSEISNNNNLINKDDVEPEEIDLSKNVLKDNNILLISEIQNKVILPYKISEIKEIFMNNENQYKDLQEIIDEKYIIPLVNYKHPSISRYREAFTLMRKREKASLFDAFDLAFEMFGKRYLSPAIITACKDLDQLDIYLDCLEKNELDDFPFFKINYELYPTKVKTK